MRHDLSSRLGHDPGSAAAALGVSVGRLCIHLLLAGVLPAAAALLCGASPLAAGMAAIAAILGGGLVVCGYLGYLGNHVMKPLTRAMDALDQLHSGEHGHRLRESGAPIARLLAEQINAANLAVDQRGRISQVRRQSAEAAFERIHAVVQSLIEGVILIDADGNVVLTNPCARQFLQRGDKLIEGQPLESLLSDGLREPVLSGLDSLAEGRDQVQVMGLRVDGRVYDVSVVRAHSRRLGLGFGTVIALVDVTRNHEISKLKDEFMSSVSHELRTPLTNICAFTEILGSVTPEREKDWQEFLSIVDSESHRLKGLVDDLLEHSQLQTGKVDWRSDPIDIGAQVEDAVTQFRERASNEEIRLHWTPPPEPCIAVGDRGRLRDVLGRLIDNALKFTPAGGSVRVEVADLQEAIEVSVDDSGPGVAAEDRETVFERFCQIGDYMTEKPSGAGLGLPICRGFVDGMAGSIWCEDSELGGARFRFVLPAVDEAAASE